MPVWWLSLWPHSMKVLVSHLLANWSLSVWSLHILPMLSEYTGFLPQSKDV